MKTSTRTATLRRDLPLAVAFALGALSLVSPKVHAANLDPVTISAPRVTTVGRDSVTNAPIEKTTATAVVKFDPVTLTTYSGVALLKDSVRTAARKACAVADTALDQMSLDDQSCVIRTVRSTQPEITAAIARARSDTNG